jgi:hypothetical protein
MNICGLDGGIAPVAPGPLCSCRITTVSGAGGGFGSLKQYDIYTSQTKSVNHKKKKSLPRTIMIVTMQLSNERQELVNTSE